MQNMYPTIEQTGSEFCDELGINDSADLLDTQSDDV